MKTWLLTALPFLLFVTGNSVFAVEGYPYPKDVRINILNSQLARCMTSLVQSYDSIQTVRPGRDYFSHYRTGGEQISCRFDRGNFFSFLVVNQHRACDYETGLEPDLRNWIINQPNNSIRPFNLFQKSMELHNGHIFNSLVAIHQLLRNEARWWSHRFYDYDSNPQKEHQFFAKFVDIRGDLFERDPQRFVGDHEGSWYRIWGIMLYRLMLIDADQDIFSEQMKSDLTASMVAYGAETSKYLIDLFGNYTPGGDRSGKMRINVAGQMTAGYLLVYSRYNYGGSLEKFHYNSDYCQNGRYLHEIRW